MRKSLLVGLALIVAFTLSSIVPFASAQNTGQGSQSLSLEEQLKLAHEKVVITSDSHPTGTIPVVPFFNMPWNEHTAFFVYSIFGIIIVCGSTFFILFVRMRRISFNKTKNSTQ
ncbi:MAG: hypothetical protein AUI60_04780 [Thaumarchaeota archaeon 13_1_40CM_2_39_4]|nr:MAG: hypothetical protein AUI60_04780 [Thaumarchaeota archaeon 13_1_40CM_2_39_4]